MRTHKYKIGQQFKTRGKHPKLCTVTELLTLTNSKGEVVEIRYEAKHEFMGQIVTDYSVPETTIAMGLIEDKKNEQFT